MCRLKIPQLEEALKGFPLYSQDGKGKNAVCCAIFALGGILRILRSCFLLRILTRRMPIMKESSLGICCIFCKERIVKENTHDECTIRHGYYYELINKQLIAGGKLFLSTGGIRLIDTIYRLYSFTFLIRTSSLRF